MLEENDLTKRSKATELCRIDAAKRLQSQHHHISRLDNGR
jgi:hypothetical protein